MKTIKNRNEFNDLFKRGNRLFSKNIGFYFLKDESLSCGFAVSRQVGNAVNRNKVKRRFREIVRLNSELLPKIKLVIFIKLGCDQIKFADLEKEYINLLKKLELNLNCYV